MNNYPSAVNPELVGEYPAYAKSGAGYFFDDILEYRVWCHPECGAPDEFDGEDYYYAFANYEDALAFANNTEGAEQPLVLIRQWEWINEPSPNEFIHEKGERIAEWRVEWLARCEKQKGEIEEFIKKGYKESGWPGEIYAPFTSSLASLPSWNK